MIQFQAPVDILDLRKMQMLEDQQRMAQQEQLQQGIQQDIGGVIQQFAGMYAENKALDAKAGAYKEFLGRHGAQLGLDPEWIKGFAKAPRDQQLAAGDLLTGQIGQRYFGIQHLNRQAELYPRRGGGGTGGGMLYDFGD